MCVYIVCTPWFHSALYCAFLYIMGNTNKKERYHLELDGMRTERLDELSSIDHISKPEMLRRIIDAAYAKHLEMLDYPKPLPPVSDEASDLLP